MTYTYGARWWDSAEVIGGRFAPGGVGLTPRTSSDLEVIGGRFAPGGVGLTPRTSSDLAVMLGPAVDGTRSPDAIALSAVGANVALPLSVVSGPGLYTFRACRGDYPLRGPDGELLAPLTLAVVRVGDLALGADVMLPLRAPREGWYRASLTRTPDAMWSGEVTGEAGARSSLSTARMVTSLPLAGLPRATLAAITGGPSSGGLGLALPSVSLVAAELTSTVFRGAGGVEFSAPPVVELGTWPGPDPDRVVFAMASDPPVGPYPAPGDVFVAFNPRFRP